MTVHPHRGDQPSRDASGLSAMLLQTVDERMGRSVASLSADANVGQAADLMKELRIRHVVIGERCGECLHFEGLLSDRDVFLGLASASLELDDLCNEDLWTTPVADLMARDEAVTGPGRPVIEALRAMIRGRVGCVPVLKDRTLVGVLTSTNALQFALELSEAGRGAASTVFGRLVESLAGTVGAMGRLGDVPVLPPDAPLSVALTLMRGRGHRQVVIVDDFPHPIGVLSERDVLRSLPRAKTKLPCGDGARRCVECLDIHQPEVEAALARDCKAFMSTSPITVNRHDLVTRAIWLMLRWDISCLPVVNADGLIDGIITRTHLLETLVEAGDRLAELLGPRSSFNSGGPR